MEVSWQGTEIKTGLEDLRNLFSSCINIYRAANVDKALGDTEMSLVCPFPGGVSSYSINNKKAEGVKCHKGWAGEMLGEHSELREGICPGSVALTLAVPFCGFS